MSEEKKAIDTLKEVASDDFDTLGDDISPKMAQNILNLIDKQQKEIQRLEKDNDTLSELVIVNEDKVIKELDLISKDKIREKIKEIESFDKAMHQKNGQFTILVLQGLLKEDDGDHIPRID